MHISFAPLEGVTDAVYRRTHHACFGGVDKYYIPFLSPTQTLVLSPREKRSIDPAENAGVPVVPQVLTKDVSHFLWAARELAELGYDEVNLNVGCPSGTVTAKGKGAGMLRDPEGLSRFLDAVCAQSPLPVSVKTRIGFDAPEEWPALLAVYAQYPLKSLIVHSRTRSQFYKGDVCRDAFAQAQGLPCPVIYNGDLFTADDCREISTAYPFACGFMMGRGLLANPALAQQLTGGEALTLDSFRVFHDRLFRAYTEAYPDNVAVGRMREVMNHAACCFEDPAKPLKAIRKARTASAYLDAARMLFDNHALLDDPHYSPA